MIQAAAIQWSPGIRWSPAICWSPAIRWSIKSMDFDQPKVYGDTSITDGLVLLWGPPSMRGELGMAEKWSILAVLAVLSTPLSGLRGSKMVSPCNCFWSFGTHFGQFKTRLIFVLQNISTKPGQNLKNRTLGALPPLLWLVKQKQPAPFQKSRRKELKEHVEDEKWL